MKPSWNDAPDWAQYLAMDASGNWYWYAVEPECDYENHWKSKTGDEYIAAGYSIGWTESLEKRP